MNFFFGFPYSVIRKELEQIKDKQAVWIILLYWYDFTDWNEIL